jgi:outer membrane protein assembly factor BamE (lipoprotein component of BamABCDE complex)
MGRIEAGEGEAVSRDVFSRQLPGAGLNDCELRNKRTPKNRKTMLEAAGTPSLSASFDSSHWFDS